MKAEKKKRAALMTPPLQKPREYPEPNLPPRLSLVKQETPIDPHALAVNLLGVLAGFPVDPAVVALEILNLASADRP